MISDPDLVGMIPLHPRDLGRLQGCLDSIQCRALVGCDMHSGWWSEDDRERFNRLLKNNPQMDAVSTAQCRGPGGIRSLLDGLASPDCIAFWIDADDRLEGDWKCLVTGSPDWQRLLRGEQKYVSTGVQRWVSGELRGTVAPSKCHPARCHWHWGGCAAEWTDTYPAEDVEYWQRICGESSVVGSVYQYMTEPHCGHWW